MPDEHVQHGESPETVFESAKLGLWTFLATEILLFGGLFTAYIVFRLRYPDLFHTQYLNLSRTLGLLNTLILITSSLTMALAIGAIRRGRQWMCKICLVLTIMFALGFLGVKYVEWTEHFSRGQYPGSNIFFSLYFMMTGLHGLHVFAGICVLTTVLVMSCRGKFSGQYATPVEITGLYWHFVDLVWIYLFPLLYLVG